MRTARLAAQPVSRAAGCAGLACAGGLPRAHGRRLGPLNSPPQRRLLSKPPSGLICMLQYRRCMFSAGTSLSLRSQSLFSLSVLSAQSRRSKGWIPEPSSFLQLGSQSEMLKSSTHLLTSKQPAKLHHLHAAAVGATRLGDDVNASERSCDARAPGCRGGVHAFICNRTAFFGFT